MTIRTLFFWTFPGLFLLTQSGCATALLSQEISRNHKRLYIHHLDEDRVDKVNQAGRNDQGAIRIVYTGSHGPSYRTQTWCMTLSPRRLASTPTKSSAAEKKTDPYRIPLRVKRSATRSVDSPELESGWTPIPVLEVPRLRDLDIEALRFPASGQSEAIYVVFSSELRHRTLLSSKPSKGPVSTGIGILFVDQDPKEPSRLMIPHVPRKSTHDFSGLGYRCLYPFAIAWDVVTFPVQAVAVVWVLQDSSGGWLF
jgi:hypothetical protein